VTGIAYFLEFLEDMFNRDQIWVKMETNKELCFFHDGLYCQMGLFVVWLQDEVLTLFEQTLADQMLANNLTGDIFQSYQQLVGWQLAAKQDASLEEMVMLNRHLPWPPWVAFMASSNLYQHPF
jgi:hypothetical protein